MTLESQQIAEKQHSVLREGSDLTAEPEAVGKQTGANSPAFSPHLCRRAWSANFVAALPRGVIPRWRLAYRCVAGAAKFAAKSKSKLFRNLHTFKTPAHDALVAGTNRRPLHARTITVPGLHSVQGRCKTALRHRNLHHEAKMALGGAIRHLSFSIHVGHGWRSNGDLLAIPRTMSKSILLLCYGNC